MRRLGAPSASIRFRSGTSAGIRSCLETTDCLAILPGSVVRAIGRRYDITALPLDLTGPTRRIGLVSQARRADARLVARFRAHLRAEFAKIAEER